MIEIRDERDGHVVGAISDEIVANAIAQAIAEDRQNRRFSSTLAYIIFGVALVVVVSLLINSFNKLSDEVSTRRSQVCTSFESAHKQEVKQLSDTYKYLAVLPASEQKLGFNKAVARQVPQLERAAKSDQDQEGVFVPLYCDKPGVGQPEPDPVVPSRPLGVDQYLKKVIPPPAPPRNNGNQKTP